MGHGCGEAAPEWYCSNGKRNISTNHSRTGAGRKCVAPRKRTPPAHSCAPGAFPRAQCWREVQTRPAPQVLASAQDAFCALICCVLGDPVLQAVAHGSGAQAGAERHVWHALNPPLKLFTKLPDKRRVFFSIDRKAVDLALSLYGPIVFSRCHGAVIPSPILCVAFSPKPSRFVLPTTCAPGTITGIAACACHSWDKGASARYDRARAACSYVWLI